MGIAMPRLPLAMLVAATVVATAPAAANEFCDKDLRPLVEQRQTLTAKLTTTAKQAKQTGSRDQFCGTLNAYIGNLQKFLAYIEENKDFCGVPDEAIEQAKKGLSQNQSLRKKVCLAAAQPQTQQQGSALQGSALQGSAQQGSGQQGSAQQGSAQQSIPRPPVELRLQ
jgi:hypothetical protein